MIFHTIKQSFRSMWRYKSFTLINLVGLSVGIASVLILYLVAYYEKSFDRLHSSNDSIYRAVSETQPGGIKEYSSNLPYPTARFFRSQTPGIPATGIHYDQDRNVRIEGQQPISETKLLFADSFFFQVMDFARVNNFRVAGNPEAALKEPNKAILTESTAARYFGKQDAIGKVFKLDNKVDIEVAAIVKDLPPTTHLPFNMIISYSTLNKDLMAGLDINSWTFRSNGYTYIRLPSENAKAVALTGLNNIFQQNAREITERKEKISLQQLGNIHFDTTYESSNPAYTVSPRYLRMLLILGVFIILIACVNYINLSTSLGFSKAKEVGIRKTIGASRIDLFFHYMQETFLLTSIAAVIGTAITILALSAINKLLDKSVNFEGILNPGFILTGIASLVIISLLSGIYPAAVVSGFNPVRSIKSQLSLPGKSSVLLRKSLVVFQFATSIALIICTVVIAKQVKYFTHKDLGFNKDAVVEIPLPESDSASREHLRSLLQNQAGIGSFSFCLGAPISDNGINTSMKSPELSEGEEHSIKIIPCDAAYINTYGLQLMAGRWFTTSEEQVLGMSMVVNEATVRALGYKKPADAIGKKISLGLNRYSPAIIGVVKDFHTSSLHEGIMPVTLLSFPHFYYAAGVRVNQTSLRSSLAAIESAWRKVFPNDVYKYNFIDEALANRYRQETMDYNLFKAFSAVSIFICCIGLWGLIAFVVVRKTKEIGIRKILGASVSGIVALLSKDFVLLVVIALVIASPVSYYFMNKWLENFVYRVDIEWWVFAIAGSFAVGIALVTISAQAIKAALVNPVKNLRSE
jgi:putative ABC transport system permease protein